MALGQTVNDGLMRMSGMSTRRMKNATKQPDVSGKNPSIWKNNHRHASLAASQQRLRDPRNESLGIKISKADGSGRPFRYETV